MVCDHVPSDIVYSHPFLFDARRVDKYIIMRAQRWIPITLLLRWNTSRSAAARGSVVTGELYRLGRIHPSRSIPLSLSQLVDHCSRRGPSRILHRLLHHPKVPGRLRLDCHRCCSFGWVRWKFVNAMWMEHAEWHLRWCFVWFLNGELRRIKRASCSIFRSSQSTPTVRNKSSLKQNSAENRRSGGQTKRIERLPASSSSNRRQQEYCDTL